MVGFVFDTILYKKDNDYYGMTLTYDFFKDRYLDKIDRMSIITRSLDISLATGNIDGYKKTNGNNIYVNPIKEYNQIPDAVIKRKKISDELKKQLVICDKVIIRMPSVLGIMACDICERNNIPYMIEMVACAWDGYCNHTNKIGKIVAPFMFYFTKRCVLNCKYVLYVTNDFLQRRYPTKGKQFSCSDVILSDRNDRILEKKLKSMSNFNKKDFSMCTVANVGMKYKGHIYVLKAMKKLKNKGYNIKYFLAGNGNQEYLKKYIKKANLESNVIFLGSLTHDKIFELLDEIDVYIQPSLQEGLPRATIEAMSRACVCIGSDVGGIPELLNSKMIFRRKKVRELMKILSNINKKLVCDESKQNYHNSKKFEKKFLDNKRNEIYNGFIKGE